MDFRQLSYFIALFEEGSVTRAARRVNVVQPALSMQIAKLEAELEQKLFERLPKAMEPTAAGRALYRFARPILTDLASARERMARMAHTSVSGRVRIGILSSLANSVVPDVLVRYRAAHPDVELSLADGYSTTFIDWVTDRQLDLAIINKPSRNIGLVSHAFMDEEMVLAGAHGTALPVPAPVRLQDLPRFVLLLPSLRHGLRKELERHLEAERITVAPMIEFDSPTGIADCVARSDLFTVLPSIAISRWLENGSLIAYRVVAPRLTRQLVVIHLPDRPMSAAAALLVDELRTALEAASSRIRGRIIDDDRLDH